MIGICPYVIVQHPETGEWVRYFPFQADAERYKEHVEKDRGMLAHITPDITRQDRMKAIAYGRRMG